MTDVHNFRQPEFRERVTEAILEMLGDFPETQRNIFIWNHYRGCQPKQIAEILKCSPSEVEATLDAISSILRQRTRSLLEEDLQCNLSPKGVDIGGKGVPRDIVDPERIVFTDCFPNKEGNPRSSGCLSRFLDLGLPSD